MIYVCIIGPVVLLGLCVFLAVKYGSPNVRSGTSGLPMEDGKWRPAGLTGTSGLYRKDD